MSRRRYSTSSSSPIHTHTLTHSTDRAAGKTQEASAEICVVRSWQKNIRFSIDFRTISSLAGVNQMRVCACVCEHNNRILMVWSRVSEFEFTRLRTAATHALSVQVENSGEIVRRCEPNNTSRRIWLCDVVVCCGRRVRLHADCARPK